MLSEENIRIDVVKKSAFVIEIVIRQGNDVYMRHTIELNPEIFTEEDADRIMEAWAKLIQMQAYAMHTFKGFADNLFRFLFDDSMDED